ncbi:MAG: hypothetical protein ACLP8B_05535 [Xanthobacteraceae bacterium]
MLFISSILAGIWDHLLWTVGLGLCLTLLEYWRPAGRQPTLAARAANIFIIVLVLGALGIGSYYVGPLYDWLAFRGLLGADFVAKVGCTPSMPVSYTDEGDRL